MTLLLFLVASVLYSFGRLRPSAVSGKFDRFNVSDGDDGVGAGDVLGRRFLISLLLGLQLHNSTCQIILMLVELVPLVHHLVKVDLVS